MTLFIAIQMDDIHQINIHGDSTFAMMREAARRNYKLFYYMPKDLSYINGEIVAHGHFVTVNIMADKDAPPFTLQKQETINLAAADVVLMRQDPPFDMGYITATHLLDFLHPKPFVVNNPTSVRNAPEKLFTLHFKDLMPETLVSRHMGDIKNFHKEYGDIIVKPLHGNGGAGIFKLSPHDPNLDSLLEMFFASSSEPLMIQRFIKNVTKGDKRIILADGVPIGAINRVPLKGQIRSNMHVGGQAMKSELTEKEREICARLEPILKEQQLIFTGIDVIDGCLTEINVTSPTGLQEIGRFNNSCPEGDIWDAIENYL